MLELETESEPESKNEETDVHEISEDAGEEPTPLMPMHSKSKSEAVTS